jgi:hypothetical protein
MSGGLAATVPVLRDLRCINITRYLSRTIAPASAKDETGPTFFSSCGKYAVSFLRNKNRKQRPFSEFEKLNVKLTD